MRRILKTSSTSEPGRLLCCMHVKLFLTQKNPHQISHMHMKNKNSDFTFHRLAPTQHSDMHDRHSISHFAVLISALCCTLISRCNAAGELTPPYFNLAEGRRITASSTCGVGIEGRELYCKLVGSHTDDQQNNTLLEFGEIMPSSPSRSPGHVVIQGQQCDYCSVDSHPVENAIDGTEKWWQSPPLSRGMKFNEVNLTIDFGQVRGIFCCFLFMRFIFVLSKFTTI